MTLDPPRKKRSSPFYFTVGFSITLVVCFFFWLFFLRFWKFTDDAYVEGNKVLITPLHHGFVTSIHTDDTFLVRKGDLLVELDKTDSLIAFNAAKENLAGVVREVCQLYHQVFAYEAEVAIKKAELIKVTQDFEHRFNVLEAGGVSLENYEHAVAALRVGIHALAQTEALYEKAVSLIQGINIKDHPFVLKAADAVRDTFVRLYRCNIYSPVDGLVAQRTIQVGMWIKEGTPLMSVIPLDQIWVNANYKETQVKRMRLGQKAYITADLYGISTVFPGIVVGIPGGAGNAFSLLPPQNLSGNWIKIVQRLPVRIALDPEAIKMHPLRIGLTCKSVIHVKDQNGLMVPDSRAGSPLYETPIFKKEEVGDEELISSIVKANIDPGLIEYLEKPFQLAAELYDKSSTLKK